MQEAKIYKMVEEEYTEEDREWVERLKKEAEKRPEPIDEEVTEADALAHDRRAIEEFCKKE